MYGRPMEKKPEIDTDDLEVKAKEDPKSKRHNNVNSRKNLKQYQEPPVVPEVLDAESAEEEVQAQEITVGRKLSPELIKKLMPQRGVFTGAEKKRFTGIVVQYLSDFKNEEPTAADIDDIFEIAKSDVMEMRLLQATKNDPQGHIAVSQSLEKIWKRKQISKENLASRRIDRKDSRSDLDVTIVDLVVIHDRITARDQQAKVERLLAEVDETSEQLKKVLDDDGY
jgi:hypothetical protein